MRADRDCKPLLVFLHSDLHEEAGPFVRDALFHPDVAGLLNTRCVAWGGSVHARCPGGVLHARQNTTPPLYAPGGRGGPLGGLGGPPAGRGGPPAGDGMPAAGGR